MSKLAAYNPPMFSSMSKSKFPRLQKPKLRVKIPAPSPVTYSPLPPIPVKETTQRTNRWPDQLGRFGKYGGKFVPETIIQPLKDLESAFRSVSSDAEFQKELHEILRDYVGRESPLYFAERLTNYYKQINNGEGPDIYLKREDLNYTGAHTINNSVGQALLAKHLQKKRIVAETGNGHHGVSTAAICARLGMQCTIYMGVSDMAKNPDCVAQIELFGGEVRPVNYGGAVMDATSEAIRDMVGNLDSTYYILGSAVGPHPYPMMVREFQAVIGRETRKQAIERWGGKPDVLVACVGGGSNAMGLFHEFLNDDDVRLIGIEGAGHGLNSKKHAATLGRGSLGVLQGAMSYLLQDEDGQIQQPHSVATGLAYPGVGPEHSNLKDTRRAEYYSVTDQESLAAFKRLSQLEGIIPALEACHALAYLEVLCPTLCNGTKVVVNLSGRGDKDVATAAKYIQLP